jgi:hypothetical protein
MMTAAIPTLKRRSIGLNVFHLDFTLESPSN